MESIESSNWEERFKALDRRQKRTSWYLAALFLGTVALGGEALLSQRRAKIVEAEEFVVKDRSGKVRGRLGLAPGGLPRLVLIDDQGRTQVALEIYADNNSALSFNDRGQTRIHLDASGDGAATLRMYDRGSQSHATMFMWKDGRTGLAFDHNKESVVLGLSPTSASGLRVTDLEGNDTGSLGDEEFNAKELGFTAFGSTPDGTEQRIVPTILPLAPLLFNSSAIPIEPKQPVQANQSLSRAAQVSSD